MPVGNKMFQGEFTEVSEMSNRALLTNDELLTDMMMDFTSISTKTPLGERDLQRNAKE